MRKGEILAGRLVQLVGSRYHTNKIVPVLAVRTDGPWIVALDVDVGDGRLTAFPPCDLVPMPEEPNSGASS